MEEPLLNWRKKNMIFIADDVNSGRFKRRIGKIGTRKDCSAKSKERPKVLKLLFEKYGQSVPDRLLGRLTVTSAYWLLERQRLTGIDISAIIEREEMPMIAVAEWFPTIIDEPAIDTARRMSCLAAAATLLKAGENKWRVVQEAIRRAPGEVAGMYAGGLRLSDGGHKAKAFVQRAKDLSPILEQGTPPGSYLYLKGKRSMNKRMAAV